MNFLPNTPADATAKQTIEKTIAVFIFQINFFESIETRPKVWISLSIPTLFIQNLSTQSSHDHCNYLDHEVPSWSLNNTCN